MTKTREKNSAELDANKICDTQKELRTRFTDMKRFRNVDARAANQCQRSCTQIPTRSLTFSAF